MLVFAEGRNKENPEKILSEQLREATTNSTHISRREPGPHWWKASVLTTALSLLLEVVIGQLSSGNLAG